MWYINKILKVWHQTLFSSFNVCDTFMQRRIGKCDTHARSHSLSAFIGKDFQTLWKWVVIELNFFFFSYSSLPGDKKFSLPTISANMIIIQ